MNLDINNILFNIYFIYIIILMTSILNVFSNSNNKKIVNEDRNSSYSLNQGINYKNYKNKIIDNLEEKINYVNAVEGFEQPTQGQPQSLEQMQQSLQLSKNGLTSQTNNIITSNDIESQKQTIGNLKKEYQIAMKAYEKIQNEIKKKTNGYLERINPNNIYLNKVVRFNPNKFAYVTNQGVVKYIPNRDVFNSLPSDAKKNINSVNISWDDAWTRPGIQIATNPPLVSGTPMEINQSVGNEGSNVFVNQLIGKTTTTYTGCYADDTTSPLMTFIGGAPALTGGTIQNGSFSQPSIANNTYKYINSTSEVPGWSFNGVLINDSTAWGYPIPYPNGTQAACIQNTHKIEQFIYLNAGDYALDFQACGRPSTGGNPIDMKIIQSDGNELSKMSFTSGNTWVPYNSPFSVTISGKCSLSFTGTNKSGDKSSAIQDVKITLTSTTTSTGGSYTYEQCQEAAINEGYRYFALQNMNTETSTGYCAVGNNEPKITKLGEGRIVSKQIVLWDSKTSGQTGNVALLNETGQLVVNDSNASPVFQTENNSNVSSTYIGCYGDKSTRAMKNTSNGAYYNLDKCKSLAEEQGYKYFAGQNARSSNGEAIDWCAGSNSLSEIQRYGKSTNCKTEDKIIKNGNKNIYHGGGWANAVYSLEPNDQYFLILQDDGNMVIYRGKDPNDNQGVIWSSATNGKQQKANPAYEASKGKYGKNWMPTDSTLAAGDFIGSTKGDIALVMQSDGNLVLYTFDDEVNCKRMSDRKTGGGVGANALYDIGKKGSVSNLTQLAYIDQDSRLHPYAQTDVKYDNSYTKFKGDSAGNDIPDAKFGDATIDSCKAKCDSIPDCAGFTFDEKNKICYPKTNKMYPNSKLETNKTDFLTYIRGKTPAKLPLGAKNNITNIDSILYGAYPVADKLSDDYGLKNATSIQKQQMSQLQTKMDQLASQINSLNNKFGQGLEKGYAQVKSNKKGIGDYIKDIELTNKKIDNIGSNVDNILNDSDIVVLQKNYNYLFWSILATGSVLVTMNIVKNNN